MDDKLKNELINKKHKPLFCVDCAHCRVVDKPPSFVSDYCTLKRMYLPEVRGYADVCNYYTSSISDATEELKKATLEYMEKQKPGTERTTLKDTITTFGIEIEAMFAQELAILGIQIKEADGRMVSDFKQRLINRNIGLYQENTPNTTEYYAKDLTTGEILFKWRLEMFIDPFNNKITETFNKII